LYVFVSSVFYFSSLEGGVSMSMLVITC